MKGLGTFLKWVIKDCLREESIEMEEAEIKEKSLRPAITSIAKGWYRTKVDASTEEANVGTT